MKQLKFNLRNHGIFDSRLICIGTIILCLFSCAKPTPQVSLEERSLIPTPVSLQPLEGTFQITADTQFYIQDTVQKATVEFIDRLVTATGFDIKVNALSTETPTEGFVVKLSDQVDQEEGYALEVTADRLVLEAGSQAGIFRGLQTVIQLLPSAIVADEESPIDWLIPAVAIKDYPLYEYRAAMLDVSRHFFSVADVKKYIDYIAAYKMNNLHLHLTDDQGWRIEIKSWPELTGIGASTQVGGGKGGFYTQEDYKDIVQYAADKYITIVPEIDMPGHTNAALSAYPELNCDGKATEPYTGTDVGFSTLCIDKDITYEFINDVIGELAALTPGEYIHIGGDESHSTELEDFIFFMEKVQQITKDHGKKAIGWDEIVNAELLDETLVQFWAKDENAKAAVAQGNKLIVSKAAKAYMDMKYDTLTPLGLNWAGLITVQTGYDWDPASLVEGIDKNDIYGVEAPLWGETLTSMDDVEYLMFPRILGYAEIGWSQGSQRDWDTYKTRLAKQHQRFELMDINFYESKQVEWDKLLD
ncbi:family 20 glycosylhydrolase [Galbibacter sp.]|uniref:family 20 glycosylhydrolase n=1 Tax=Galbibacter sp. TaxID=2918471 RepID=UPI003A8F3FA4